MSKDQETMMESLGSMSIDELIRSTKEDLGETPEEERLFEPELPTEYADLSVDDELLLREEEDEELYRLPAVLRVMLYVCCVLAASVLLAVGAWKCFDDVCALTARDNVVTVTIAEGNSIADVTQMLKDKGLIRYKWLFSLYCMLANAEQKIDPGTYQLNEMFDYHALVNGMIETSENRATVRVTIPEGYEAEDIFALLEESGVCAAGELENAAANYQFEFAFLNGLEYGDFRRLEGYLFPDTYEFYVNDEAPNVLAKFLRNFDNKITDEMYADLDALNDSIREKLAKENYSPEEIESRMLTFHDVIIVASLVEKETTRTAESATISSVIYNRLCSKLYPCLNIDATIQYVLPERKEILTLADKSVISPYNTYTNAGLPVGPISNPGINSIRAALYPADTKYYFYALVPGANNHFSETAAEHQEFLDELSGKALQEQEEERLRQLAETRLQMKADATIQEARAIEIALEEASKEKYQYQSWISDFSDQPEAELLINAEEIQEHLWAAEWEVTDSNGEKLYSGQPVWMVRITDKNDSLTSLIIYVDSETGAVVGAGQLSD